MHAVRCRTMDNIDRIMKEAERLGFGVSYGKYRAAYPNGCKEVLPAAPARKAPEKKSKTCKHCEKSFVPKHYSQCYCSIECADQSQQERQQKYYVDQKTKAHQASPLKFCKECGVTIPADSMKKTYCCAECAREGRRKVSASWRAAKKKEG